MTDENSRKLIRFFTSTCIFNLNQTSVEYVIETALALNGDPVAREKIEMMVAACIQTLFDLNGLTLSAPQRE
ncbi:hypothetical protein EXS57_02115 [Candidatus Kaiserbacteria bacterium]|nr:hypothetical protein [Candidatus Kaiserbacteria bacterium]